MFFYFDYYYLILVVPALILSIFAQIKVSSTFSAWSKVTNKQRITGAQAAQILLKQNNITDVRIESVPGSLTDHYDPKAKVLRLSAPVYGESSIAAVGVAAHETGHAIQHAKKYKPLVLRSILVPIAGIGSGMGPLLAILGIIFSWGWMINIGLLLFGGAIVFYLVTLPVEFNASKRAIAILRGSGSLSEDELTGVKKVLSAAAMTYVASALTAIANFARLILLSRNRRN